MSEGLFQFELDGEQIELYFGMKSVLLFSEKYTNELAKNGDVDAFKSFAYIIFSGLVNQADRKETAYPTFESAYDLTEKINLDDKLAKDIFDFWNNCKATQKLIESVNSANKSNAIKKKKPQKS